MGDSDAGYISVSRSMSASVNALQNSPKRACVREKTVRLEGHDQPPVGIAFLGGSEIGLNFSRVMAVVIHHHDAFVFTFAVKASAHAAKVGEAGDDVFFLQPCFKGHTDAGQGVEYVVRARLCHSDFAPLFAVQGDFEQRAQVGADDLSA